MKLSIIIPAFNEEKRLPDKLAPYIDYLEKKLPDYEIVLVNDGSTDKTLQTILGLADKNPKIKIINSERNRGRGFGMKAGVLAGSGEYILETDADLPVTPDHIHTFMNFLEAHPEYQLVIGSREHPDSRFPLKQPPLRVFLGKVFHWMFMYGFGIQFKDVMCGFKMFRHDAAKKIFQYVYDERFLAAGEIIYNANRLGYLVKELPVVWEDDRRSKVKIARDILRTLKGLVEMKIRALRGKYPIKSGLFKKTARQVKKMYGGRGWPSLFTKIRFITAPFRQLEPHIPREGFIVDLGCGYGIFANLLGLLSPARKILGMDLDDYKIKYADRGVKNVEFKAADITKTNIPPADCILLIHVLHHLNSYEEQETLIKACLEKLKKGGRLVITEIDRKPWWKFFLTQLADRMLYPGDKIYYRFPEKMLRLLDKFSLSDIDIEIMHGKTPFSHITYICRK